MKTFKQIAIVGTGPGDPDYMTRRAFDYLQQADIVLYDCLVDEVVLTVIPSTVKLERIEKKYRKHNAIDIFDQQILKRMIECIEAGMKVVRIKPGDSMNFNSGGMEADYLKSKGYDVEMVPGVPTHLAAANLFNLNLTEIHQSNGFISFMADELGKDEHMASHIAYMMKHGGVPVCLYGMQVETFAKVKAMLQKYEICDKMPVAICGDVSLSTAQLIPTTMGDCVDLVEILANEDQLPGHFVVLMGKHILKSYVDFKEETIKTVVSCQC
jgi:uroporphyrin-III C-methyltransferase